MSTATPEISPEQGSVKASTFHQCGTDKHCNHDFKGWRPFYDGNGGERVCAKCGIGAMAYSLRCDI